MSAPAVIVIVLAATACVVSCPRAVASDDNNLPSSVKRVERETGGRVLSAERRSQSGREMNRIKVYTPEGRVRVMWDEPRHAAQPAPRNESKPDTRALRARDARQAPVRDDRR